MKGVLYLRSYYDGIMDDVYNINIARGNMKGIQDKRISLAPSKELFDWYQNNKHKPNWFKDYNKVYLNQLKDNPAAINELNNIKHLLDEGKDVCIYCFCRNVKKCHRGIIGRLFLKKGYKVIVF